MEQARKKARYTPKAPREKKNRQTHFLVSDVRIQNILSRMLFSIRNAEPDALSQIYFDCEGAAYRFYFGVVRSDPLDHKSAMATEKGYYTDIAFSDEYRIFKIGINNAHMEVMWQNNPEASHYGSFTIPFPHSHKLSALPIFKLLFPNSINPFASKRINKRL